MVGRHPLPFESLFGFPLGWILELVFKHRPVLSRHVYTILVSNLGMKITTIVVNQAILKSFSSELIVEVIVIMNLGLLYDR